MKGTLTLRAAIPIAAAASTAGTAALTALYLLCGASWLLSAAITAGTTAYHLLMRLAVGNAVNAVIHNRADCGRAWYRPRPWEEPLYRLLRVRRWKDKLPSYDPAQFSPRDHTLDELAQAMCQSESVHLLCAALSFLPLLAARRLGAFPVFLITSVLASCVDGSFCIMQRYNRPRVLRAAQKQRELQARRTKPSPPGGP